MCGGVLLRLLNQRPFVVPFFFASEDYLNLLKYVNLLLRFSLAQNPGCTIKAATSPTLAQRRIDGATTNTADVSWGLVLLYVCE